MKKILKILKSKIFIFSVVSSTLVIVVFVIFTHKAPPMKKAVIINFSSHPIAKDDLEFYLIGVANPIKLKNDIPPFSVDCIDKTIDNVNFHYLDCIMLNDFSGNQVKIVTYPFTYNYLNPRDGKKMKARIYRDSEGDIYRLDISDENEGDLDAIVFINKTLHNFGVTHVEYNQTGLGTVQLYKIERDIFVFKNPNKYKFKSYLYDISPPKTLESNICNFSYPTGSDGPNSIGMEMSNLEGGHDKP